MAISYLGKQVLLRRRDVGWTQEVLASKAGLGMNTIARLERGLIQDLRGQAIVRLARALGMTPNELLGVAGEHSEN